MPTKDSPQAFMAVGFRDRTSEPLALAYTRFLQAGVPAEFHVYANAGHPDGFREKDRTPASKWPERFYEWLDDRGMLKGSDPPAGQAGPRAAPPASRGR
jgi:endo-1,4-beta-xylanase